MSWLKTYKFLFVLAAIIFIAKPFVGFCVAISSNPKQSYTILAKSFCKRKPETAEDAEKQAAALRHLLINPLAKQLITISFLLAMIMPLVFGLRKLTHLYLKKIFFELLPERDCNLFTGKLVI